MECNLQNKDTQTSCEALMNEYYKESVDGKFKDVTTNILNDTDQDTDEETVATDDGPIASDNCK